MTPDQIKSLRELLAKATPGPWEAWACHPTEPDEDWRPFFVGPTNGADCESFAECDWEPDAQLIAAAVNNLDELLDAAEELDRHKKALEVARQVFEDDVGVRYPCIASETLTEIDRILAGEEPATPGGGDRP